MQIRTALTSTLMLFAAPLAAKSPLLSLPIDCTLGETCYIQQFVDRDPTTGTADYACGDLTYDGHKGTDIAVHDLAAMQAGVNVLAAAPGRVTAIRDTMPDRIQAGENAPDVTGKECGNGIVIDHGDGWETQYCHMKRGSISVERGQRVGKGTVLGHVGLSGKTEFPHIHISVRHDGAVVDPFAPDDFGSCDATQQNDMWQVDMPYTSAGIITIGFDQQVPAYSDITAGHSGAHLSATSPAMVIWAYAYGGRQGDVLEISFDGPNGNVITHQALLEKSQALFFRAAGKRIPEGGWPIGSYAGHADIIRNGAVLASKTLTINITN